MIWNLSTHSLGASFRELLLPKLLPQRLPSASVNAELSHNLINFFPLRFYLPPNLIMSTLEDLEDLEREQKEDKRDDGDKDKKPNQSGDAEMKDADAEEKEEDPIDEEIYSLSTQDILTRRRLLENDTRIMKSEFQRVSHEKATMGEKIKDNLDKIENNRYAKVDGTLHDN